MSDVEVDVNMPAKSTKVEEKKKAPRGKAVKVEVVPDVPYKQVNILKWNVKFDGRSDPITFVEQVEEMRVAFGVSEAQLFNSAALLFVDVGKIWFDGIKGEVKTWGELQETLYREFLPSNHDYQLMAEIRLRTQGIDEPVHLYFAVMIALFNRLHTTISEAEKLQILQHNIRPQLAMQLCFHNFETVAELKEKCMLVEGCRQRTQMFKEPSQQTSLPQRFQYKGKPGSSVATMDYSAWITVHLPNPPHTTVRTTLLGRTQIGTAHIHTNHSQTIKRENVFIVGNLTMTLKHVSQNQGR